MPILVVQRCGRVYPSSRFFRRRKLMSRNHHVEACSLFATALSPHTGARIHLASDFQVSNGCQCSNRCYQHLRKNPATRSLRPRAGRFLPVPWKNTPQIERLIAYCSSKTIDNLGNTCTTNGCFIYCGHFTIPCSNLCI